MGLVINQNIFRPSKVCKLVNESTLAYNVFVVLSSTSVAR